MLGCYLTIDLFKDEVIMLSRLLSIAFVSVLAVAAQAQLPSERFSPINYFGRYHGFGYSDGYHACKEDRCNSWSPSKHWESPSKHWGALSKPWESMSSLYGSPAPTSSNRTVGTQTTVSSSVVSQEHNVDPIQIPGSPSDRRVRAMPQIGLKSEFIPSLPQVPSRIAPMGGYFEP